MPEHNSLQGIQFPCDPTGHRSTSLTGRKIFSEAIKGLSPRLAEKIMSDNAWRNNYYKYIPEITQLGASCRDKAEDIAEQGLKECYQQFEFHRNNTIYPLQEAVEVLSDFQFHAACIEGRAEASFIDIELSHKEKQLKQQVLLQQIEFWRKSGVIDESHANDLCNAIEYFSTNTLAGKHFVLLGAGSEIGPFSVLMALGATVIAIDLDRSENWQRLITIARNSPGRLYVPCSSDPKGMSDLGIANIAGANLLQDTPEISQWIKSFNVPLTVGSYAYLDGELHVRVVMAMDAIVQSILKVRTDISLAYLLTPTDVFVVSDKALIRSVNRYKSNRGKLLKSLINRFSFRKLFSSSIVKIIKNKEGSSLGILDNLIPQQGPSYVLAKRIQRWRAIDSLKRGYKVSCNVAPASSTRSVMSNKFFLAASRGSESFGVEVFSPETANTLMTLQLVVDVKRNGLSERGEQLFMKGANHGGAWGLGYSFRSVMPFSLIVGFLPKTIRQFC